MPHLYKNWLRTSEERQNLPVGTGKFSKEQVRQLRAIWEDKDKPTYITKGYLAKLHNVKVDAMSRMLSYKTYTDVN